MAGDDKQMFKQFCQEGQPHVLEALSPPQSSGISPNKSECFSHLPISLLQLSALHKHCAPSLLKCVVFRMSQSLDEGEGPLSDKCSRKTLFYLIATLNESFRPDYDFSRTKGHDFSKEPSVNWVRSYFDTLLK